MQFRLFVFSRRKNATRKDEKTKKTPCEKTKPATRKDENLARKDEKTPCEKTPFEIFNFVTSRVASFRLFTRHLFVFSRGVISSCRLFAWRLFVFSRRKAAMRNDEETPCEKTKRDAMRKDEKTPCEKTKT